MSNLGVVLGVLVSGMMLVLLGTLTSHKLYQRFPPFVVYCIFAVCAMSVEFPVGKHPNAFFLIHWLIQGAYVLLAFVAISSGEAERDLKQQVEFAKEIARRLGHDFAGIPN